MRVQQNSFPCTQVKHIIVIGTNSVPKINCKQKVVLEQQYTRDTLGYITYILKHWHSISYNEIDVYPLIFTVIRSPGVSVATREATTTAARSCG